jgi:ADP-ribose pyrophosphatase
MQLGSRRLHTGRVVSLDVDTVRYPDGTTGELEIVRHPGAAAVVPVASDPAGRDPTVLMLRQYRYASDGVMWEVPAGRLSPGEDPVDCARRELLEEAGVRAGRIEHLTTVWATPGFSDERIHLYWAADLTAGAHAREHDEFIEVIPRPLSEVLAGIRSGDVCDAKTVVAILYMAGFVFGL